MAETAILRFALFLEILRSSKLEIWPSYREKWLKKYVQIRFLKFWFFGSKMCCSCWNFAFFAILAPKSDLLGQFSKIWSIQVFLIIFPHNLAKFQVSSTFRSQVLFENVFLRYRVFKISGPFSAKIGLF